MTTAVLAPPPLPHRRLEGWRWSAFDALEFAAPALPTSAQTAGAMLADCDPLIADDARHLGQAGLRRVLVDSHTLRGAGPFFDRARGRQGSVVGVEASASPARPLSLVMENGQAVRFVLGPQVSVVLYERVEARAPLHEASLEIEIGEGAELLHVLVQGDPASPDGQAGLAHMRHVFVGAGGTYRGVSLAFGERRARLETQIDHAGGPGGLVELVGVSLLAGDRHADQSNLVRHQVPGGRTRESFRTIAVDAAAGVFQGKIVVERPAQKTDAQMDHRALVLGTGAQVNAKPELEIYADDVQCAHGNAIGALDEGALFYMRQRGVPASRARALLVEAFIAGAIQPAIRHAALAALVARQTDAWTRAWL